MSERRGAGELEAEVLATLWAADAGLTPAEVQAELSGDLAYTTVMTILRRLYDKGLAVRSRVEGARAYRYSPAVDQAEYAAERMHAQLAAGADTSAVLVRFLGRLSREERRALGQLLGKRAR